MPSRMALRSRRASNRREESQRPHDHQSRLLAGAVLGRLGANSLEEQAKGPMANPIEMGNTHDAIVDRLKGVPGYRPLFAKAFGSEEITIDRAAMAIACFERTVFSGNAPYDKYKRGDKKAMTAAQVRGMSVFFDKAKCDRCHEGSNFTLNAYANLESAPTSPSPTWDVSR